MRYYLSNIVKILKKQEKTLNSKGFFMKKAQNF